jgi:hypothetical protein
MMTRIAKKNVGTAALGCPIERSPERLFPVIIFAKVGISEVYQKDRKR